MELSELSAYAKEKYQIEEQHKWADFPGFSVLCNPRTGKWAALLMRQWDSDTGTEIECCDIRCGTRLQSERNKAYLSAPVRMRGPKWVNVTFNGGTEPEVVFRLFDRAVASGDPGGVTVILDAPRTGSIDVYMDTPLPFAGTVTRGFSQGYTAKRREAPVSNIPDKIREMLALYDYGDDTLAQKSRLFYRQGKLMEDYEDDAPWQGEYWQYFPTYHDLTVRQLRGYFTWRTHVRKGDFRPIATSIAYLYLYELLCGIGTDSTEDALSKMKAFEAGFLDSGIGDPGMRKNLRRWRFEYAVIHGLPVETVLEYADPSVLEKDRALAALKNPKQHTDEEVFSALCAFAGKRLRESPVCAGDGSKGKHLFAEVWRRLSEPYQEDGKTGGRNIFYACFGERRPYRWHPLANAVYWEECGLPDADFVLNECRSYHLRRGKWQEKRYEQLHFDMDKFHAVIHEADRLFRKELKTGHYLRKKPEEAWVTPYIEAVMAAERWAELEAAKPKITIDFSGLEKIRNDALVTRDSLLTDEEMDADDAPPMGKQEEAPREESKADEDAPACSTFNGLDALHLRILMSLLRGQSADDIIQNNHLMPSIVTDTINEALFDEIGDNVLVCDGDRMSAVEDYIEDVMELLGGNS